MYETLVEWVTTLQSELPLDPINSINAIKVYVAVHI